MKGFTLIEILVVVAMLSILVAAAAAFLFEATPRSINEINKGELLQAAQTLSVYAYNTDTFEGGCKTKTVKGLLNSISDRLGLGKNSINDDQTLIGFSEVVADNASDPKVFCGVDSDGKLILFFKKKDKDFNTELGGTYIHQVQRVNSISAKPEEKDVSRQSGIGDLISSLGGEIEGGVSESSQPSTLSTVPINSNNLFLSESTHVENDCTDAGGSVYTSGSDVFCRFSASSCPAGWSQFNGWRNGTENTREVDGMSHYHEWDSGGAGVYECTHMFPSCTSGSFSFQDTSTNSVVSDNTTSGGSGIVSQRFINRNGDVDTNRGCNAFIPSTHAVSACRPGKSEIGCH